MAARSRQAALDDIQGEYRKQYKRIGDYCYELLCANLGSSVTLKVQRATFMSDQQKGLLPAFDKVIPGVDHRFCVCHMYNNYRKKFSGLQLKQLMWRCAKATHWKDWEREMAVVQVSRKKSIITMLEEIRVYLMSRWAVNRKRIQKFNGTILPRIRKKIKRKGRAVGEWRPYWSTAQTYEVVNEFSKYAVDLSLHECSCKKWQLSEIPCTHAISCINFKGLELDSYVDNCYKRDAYVKCYESIINTLNSPDMWEHTNFDDVMPPLYRKPSHRPVKKRKRGPDESEARCQTHLSRKGQIQRCSKCGAPGHKRGRCNNLPLPAQLPKQTAAKKTNEGRKRSISQPATRGRKRSKPQGKSSSQP
ncbi:uncharacterized protein LOC107473257 [Arachis duranensis]|uniref:Uncharacterized protein LOC107473257 n=1 Tax=Arachis duranensis TaxID=130453 RepID=A0A6P4CB61_ARADU|nr:uncharacterized protein LOC107473257 [Arachis duranensis]